jgi:hypothetical protein
MARDHARIWLDIWSDDDFRDLTAVAQWLYFNRVTSPSLSFAGVGDWRPSRIAAAAKSLDAYAVEVAAAELQAGEFILIDLDTEEVLIRSWAKHDGLIQSPNMAKALARDHALIASPILRAVLVNQLVRLRKSQPDLKGWPDLAGLLRKRSMTFAAGLAEITREPSGKGSGKPSPQPSGEPSPSGSRTPLLLNSLPPYLPNSQSSSSPSVTRGAANG